jgi:hypothetical protein
MAYCGYCGGLLPGGNYRFCGFCGQPIIPGTTQVYSTLPTTPVSSLPSTQVSFANQKRDQAYKSLCKEYESDLTAVPVFRTEDGQIGQKIYILNEEQWLIKQCSSGDKQCDRDAYVTVVTHYL